MLKKYFFIYINIYFNYLCEIMKELKRVCEMLVDSGILFGN